MNEGIFEKDPVSKIKRENDGVRKRPRWRKEAEQENELCRRRSNVARVTEMKKEKIKRNKGKRG